VAKRLDIADFLLIAEAVLGVEAERLARVMRIPAAEAALVAPLARLDGIPLFADPAERAAICCSRIIRNNPLRDGNKRVAYECMREMLDREGIPWPRPERDVDEIASTIERLAARTISEQEFASWVRQRTQLSE
jgi:death-on-curing protein